MKKSLYIFFALATQATAFAQVRYTITNLGDLGGNGSYATGVNDIGDVVGTVLTDNGSHAFLYSHGSMTDLGTLGGQVSDGFAVNDSGQTVGDSRLTTTTAYHAFLDSGGTMNDLGTLGGDYSKAAGINNSGEIAGVAKTSTGARRAFVSTTSGMLALGTLGGNYSSASAISNDGYVTGSSSVVGGQAHAFLYSNGNMQDLGALDGTSSQGECVNDLGQVAGFYENSSYVGRAFLYSAGEMKDLGTLHGGNSAATGINDSGLVVGISRSTTYVSSGFLYQNGQMLDLNLLLDTSVIGYHITGAYGISNTGFIAATVDYQGQEFAALLTPESVPEPAGFFPLVAAAIGLMLRRRAIQRSPPPYVSLNGRRYTASRLKDGHRWRDAQRYFFFHIWRENPAINSQVRTVIDFFPQLLHHLYTVDYRSRKDNNGRVGPKLDTMNRCPVGSIYNVDDAFVYKLISRAILA